MLLFGRYRAKGHRDADVAQIEPAIQFVHHVVIVGKAQARTIGTEDMYMRAATQRARGKRRRDIAGIQIHRCTVLKDHPAPVVEVILPAGIGMFRAMNADVARWQIGTDRDDADVSTMPGLIEHLHLTGHHIDPLNGLTGKRRARWTNVKRQPLAVGSPDINIGELMLTGSKGDLFF